MKNKLLLTVAMVAVAGVASAELYVVGSLQDENGATDWTPSAGLQMSQSGSIYSYTANNLLDGAFYEYKVLYGDGAAPADWGGAEPVNANTMAYGDADGSVLITVNAGRLNSGGGNVTWVETDGAPLQVVGSFMGATWNPSDPTYNMTAQGNGYYTKDLVIGTAGSYEFKATDGTGWDYQVGTDGFGNNATTFSFATTTADEAVTLFIDTANQSIGVIPEPATLSLIGLFGAGLLIARRKFQL